jgi:hypothetical protein
MTNLRHAAGMLRFGRNPAATVYDSIGADFFLALDDGWLNRTLQTTPEATRPAARSARARPVRTADCEAISRRAATSSTSATASPRRTP